MGEEENYWKHAMRKRLSRREMLRGAALAGVGIAGAGLIGCNNTQSAPTVTATTAVKAATPAGAASPASAASPTAAGGTAMLRDLLKLPTGKAAGEGLTLNWGSILPLSGPASWHGGNMSNAINLAIKHIKELGGPEIKMTYKDHKSGDPQAGANAGRELGLANIPVCITSYAAVLGSQIPSIEQYKILTLDPAGGTSTYFKSKPYFWGTRAVAPNDPWPGAYKYVTDKLPKAKKVVSTGWDTGKELVEAALAEFKVVLAKYNLELVGSEPFPIGTTDFSTTVARLKTYNADIVAIGAWGLDPAYFMKQYATSGMTAQVIGAELDPDAAKTAGSAYDKFWFACDGWDPDDTANNDWAKFLADTFRKEYKYDPQFHVANFYEDVFALWEVVRRVIAKGKDPNNGTNMQDGLLENLNFPSMYGGSGKTLGVLALDPQTHSVAKRPMGMYEVKSGKAITLATFDMDAASYKVVK